MRIAYSRHYDIGFFGLERLHPFDSKKYGRAWRLLRRALAGQLRALQLPIPRPARTEELLLVHERTYLKRLRSSRYVARALELPIVRYLPNWLVHRQVLRPMRWASWGTVLSAAAALEHGLVVNFAGGYHHAKADEGEGFCIYSDIALCVAWLRQSGRLADDQRVIYIDLDAHHGNGVCYQFLTDPRVFIFDMYNASIYPSYDVESRGRIDCDIPLAPGCSGGRYLALLEARLPDFLDSITTSQRPGLAIYNAGTDVLRDDPLGGFNLTAEDILQRDAMVIEQLRARAVPTIMLPSGGYSRQSYRLLAYSTAALVRKYA